MVKVSIIITCYNKERYIYIDSRLNQNCPDGTYEIIVANDGSTDKSRDVISLYEGLGDTIKTKRRSAYYSKTGGTYVFGSVSRDIRDTAWVEGEVVLEIHIHDPSKSTVLSTRLNANDIAVPPPRR